MNIRHIFAAGLVAGASLAQAAPTQASDASLVAGWTLKEGSVDVLGELDAAALMLATGTSTDSWNLHTSMASETGASAQLYTPVGLRTGDGLNGRSAAPGVSQVRTRVGADVKYGNAIGSVAGNGVEFGSGSDSAPQSGGSSSTGGSSTGGSSGSVGTDTSASVGTQPADSGNGGFVDTIAAGQDSVGSPAAQAELVKELIKAGPPVVALADAAQAASVPEPSTAMLMLAAMMGGTMLMRRRAN